MTPEDAIRYLDHEAARCRGRDACEALCLLLPALMRILDLDRMEDVEALAFRYGLKRDLDALPNRFGGADETRGLPARDAARAEMIVRSPLIAR